MTYKSPLLLSSVLFLSLLVPACGSSSVDPGTGSGGSHGSGGTTGSGGGGTTTGGTTGSSGGAVGSGGDNGGARTGGGAVSTGGTAGAPQGSGGMSGAPGSGGSSSTGGASGSGMGTGTGGSNPGSGLTITASWPNGAILSGVRDVSSPAATQVVQVKNGGATAVMLTALTLSGTNAKAFQINGAPQLPMSVAAGASVPVTIQALTAASAIPAAPAQNSGATLTTATLTATAGAQTGTLNLYGMILTTATHECTLGQILTALGFKVSVGAAQNNANPVSPSDASKLPKGIEPNSDEVAGQLFTKAGTGNVTMVAVARFSPKGPMPFGWYAKGSPTNHSNIAGTMSEMSDGQTSDKARMMLPPVAGSQSFDPGTATFGLWVYSDQSSQKYDTGGTASNGDYDYSEDAPNMPANTHRTKVYPLKDATGTPVADSYLVCVEEAGNGDYQDYVFVLGNVKVAQ
ncbi:MAG: hypothetical protein ABJA82_16270 [Myxococcales bacterium]